VRKRGFLVLVVALAATMLGAIPGMSSPLRPAAAATTCSNYENGVVMVKFQPSASVSTRKKTLKYVLSETKATLPAPAAMRSNDFIMARIMSEGLSVPEAVFDLLNQVPPVIAAMPVCVDAAQMVTAGCRNDSQQTDTVGGITMSWQTQICWDENALLRVEHVQNGSCSRGTFVGVRVGGQSGEDSFGRLTSNIWIEAQCASGSQVFLDSTHRYDLGPGNQGFTPTYQTCVPNTSCPWRTGAFLEAIPDPVNNQHPWQNLGGCAQGRPRIDHRGTILYVFTIDCTGTHFWRQYSTDDGLTWTGRIETNLPTGCAIGNPSAVGGDHRVDVFVRGCDNHMWTQHRAEADSDWSGWTQLPGCAAYDASVTARSESAIDVYWVAMDCNTKQSTGLVTHGTSGDRNNWSWETVPTIQCAYGTPRVASPNGNQSIVVPTCFGLAQMYKFSGWTNPIGLGVPSTQCFPTSPARSLQAEQSTKYMFVFTAKCGGAMQGNPLTMTTFDGANPGGWRVVDSCIKNTPAAAGIKGPQYIFVIGCSASHAKLFHATFDGAHFGPFVDEGVCSDDNPDALGFSAGGTDHILASAVVCDSRNVFVRLIDE
jgi:hypothetical protein